MGTYLFLTKAKKEVEWLAQAKTFKSSNFRIFKLSCFQTIGAIERNECYRKLLVAKDLIGSVSAKIGLEEGDELKILETVTGKDIVGLK